MTTVNDAENDVFYQEGYKSFLDGVPEAANPYQGLDAEFWSDGYEDAMEDSEQ